VELRGSQFLQKGKPIPGAAFGVSGFHLTRVIATTHEISVIEGVHAGA